MLSSIIERGDDKSLALFSENMGSFNQKAQEHISTALLSKERFEDTYSRLGADKMPNLIKALPADRKSEIVERLLEINDEKSLKIFGSYFNNELDWELKKQFAQQAFFLLGEEEVTKKFQPAEVVRFTGVLDDEHKLEYIARLMRNKTAQSVEILSILERQPNFAKLRSRVVLMPEGPVVASLSSVRAGQTNKYEILAK